MPRASKGPRTNGRVDAGEWPWYASCMEADGRKVDRMNEQHDWDGGGHTTPLATCRCQCKGQARAVWVEIDRGDLVETRATSGDAASIDDMLDRWRSTYGDDNVVVVHDTKEGA